MPRIFKKKGPVAYGPQMRGRPKKAMPRTKKDLTKIIKATVAKHSETKYCAETILGATNFNGTIDSAADWYRCIPALKQTDDPSIGQSWVREGKQVNPVGKLAVHWRIHFKNTLDLTRDIYVVLYVLQQKARRQYAVVDAANQNPELYAQFLDDGAGNNTNFDGTWLASTFPVEKDLFTPLHKRVFRLSKPSGLSTGQNVIGQGGTAGGYPSIQTGMYSLVNPTTIHHTWYHKLPATLKYDDGAADAGDVSTLFPNNASPCWAVGYFYANGEAVDTVSTAMSVECRSEMYFKDS